MGWVKYAKSAYGFLSSTPFVENNFGFTINENGWQAFHANDSGNEFSSGGDGIWLEWTPGQDWSRKPLFYFYRVDGNGDPIGLIGFDADVTCNYTVLGHNAQVTVRLYMCTRDLNHILVRDLGNESIGSSAISSSSYDGFALKFFFNIGKTADTHKIVLGANLEIYNATRGGAYDSEWSWAGVLSGNVLCNDVTYDTTKESPQFGPSSKPGGGYNEDGEITGSFDNSSDKITPSSKPTLTPLSTNLVHAYKVTTSMLNDIADAMYPDYIFSNTTIEDALAGIYNAIFFSKYVDFMLDLLILPIDVPAPNTVNVKVGGKYLKTANEAYIQAQLVQDPYVDFECGSLSIDEYWANFLDFAGTRIKLFLPYVGYVDIQPEYVIGGKLTVKYRFNALDGSFMAFVSSTSGQSELDESMIAQFSGVAGVHVPLQAADYSQKVSGLISAIGGVAAGAASGGLTGAVAATGIANASQTLIQKPGSSHANGYNASSSYLSHRKPYLIIERQSSQFSEKYPEEVGLPLNVMKTLGECEGLTKCEAAHLDTIPCTAGGKEKIAQLMKTGIIL